MKEGDVLQPTEIQTLFGKRIRAVVVDLDTGKIDEEATKTVATYDQQKAKKDPALSKSAPKNLAGVQRVPNKAVVYQVSKNEMGEDGSGFELTQYIFPVEGKGLWSTLYGFVAMAPDCNQIKGLTPSPRRLPVWAVRWTTRSGRPSGPASSPLVSWAATPRAGTR